MILLQKAVKALDIFTEAAHSASGLWDLLAI